MNNEVECELQLSQVAVNVDPSNSFMYNSLNQPTPKEGSIKIIVVVSSIIAAISGLLFGYSYSNISGAILELQKILQLGCNQQEIVVSVILIGGIVGASTGGYIMDRLERRTVIIATSCGLILGSVLTMGSSYALLVAGRIVNGISITLSMIATCAYISEIAPAAKRGLLVSMVELMAVFGILLAYVVNFSFVNISNGWKFTFGIVIPIALLQIIGVFYIPSSPYFLIKKGEDEKANLILKRTRFYSETSGELNNIKSFLNNESNYKCLDMFSSKSNMNFRMLIGISLTFFLQVTGQPNLLFYSSIMLKSVGFESVSAATLASVGLGLVKMFGTIVVIFFVDKVGRRTLLCVGAAAMMVSLSIIGIASYNIPMKFIHICIEPNHTSHLQDNIITVDYNLIAARTTPLETYTSSLLPSGFSTANQSYSKIRASNESSPMMERPETESVSPVVKWVLLCGLLMCGLAYSVSFGPVVWVLLSEIFPVGIKGRAMSFIGMFQLIVNLLISLTFLNVTESIGLMWMFFICATLSFVSLVFIIFLVPETKGLPLEQITEQFSLRYNVRTLSCYTGNCMKRVVPRIFQKRRSDEHCIWATDVQYHIEDVSLYSE
ncbi:solute carrier family 2, facilitated glucose transporter member 12 [Callorhinchus milii]|uniref:solute carrier family 2, facilitated glucose transporter member 12 n=1 Tax=Callorhinchus milii TaxID=7868 RepID=UPI0004571AA5|nr:solute carrier family 2, facilitated glucose transporter member 12 [Callorhinchus milii]|eukprot:gi/632970590/ref/XP_007901734.1/ PREDICTED: solute carrier family 2, facilitated glucose transporter member 12 [Callorhinchus milii]